MVTQKTKGPTENQMIIKKYNNIKAFATSTIAEFEITTTSPFNKLQWFELLQKHIIKDDEEVIYYCVLDKSKNIVAVFPLIKSRQGANGGYTLKSLANFYSMEYLPFFIRKARNCRKAISAFVDYLKTEERGWTSLEICPIDLGELSNIYFTEELSKRFNLIQSLSHINWTYHNPEENYDEYIAFSPSRIKDIKRKERRLIKKHEVNFVMWADETRLKKGIQDYFMVYNGSWKDEEQYPNFIPDLIRLCAREKMLRLGILYIDGVATAAQLNIFYARTTLIYKLSYHEEYNHLSTGAILSFKMMQHAFDQDKSLKIDYGCGNDPYKKEWMNYCRKKTTLTIYNDNFQSNFRFLRHLVKIRFKQLFSPQKFGIN